MSDLKRQNKIKNYFDGLYRQDFTPWKDHGTEPPLELFLKKIKKGSKLLDLGCGDGWISIRAAKSGIKSWGIDSSETAIKQAKKTAEIENVSSFVDFRVGDALNLPYKDKFFDAMLDRGLLHHILPENRPIYFKNITRVLKPRALMYLACFSQNNPVGIGQMFTKELIEDLFTPNFKMLKYEEDSYPTQAPAHLLHFIFKKRD